MHSRVGKQVNDKNAKHNKPHPDDGGPVELLAKGKKGDDRDEYNAQTGLDRIGDADRQVLEGLGHQIERRAIADHHQNGRHKAGELLTGLQRGGADGFKHNGNHQKQIGFGHQNILSARYSGHGDGWWQSSHW